MEFVQIYFSFRQSVDDGIVIAERAYKRLKASADHLSCGNKTASSTRLLRNTEQVEVRFLEILHHYKHNKSNIEEKRLLHSSFNKLEEQLESWLTEVEVRMISLQPYTCPKDVRDQVTELKDLNKELKERSYLLHEFNDVCEKVDGEHMSRQGIAEEFNERYKKVSLLFKFISGAQRKVLG